MAKRVGLMQRRTWWRRGDVASSRAVSRCGWTLGLRVGLARGLASVRAAGLAAGLVMGGVCWDAAARQEGASPAGVQDGGASEALTHTRAPGQITDDKVLARRLVIGLPEQSRVRGLLEEKNGEVDGFARRVAEEAARAAGYAVEFRNLPDHGRYELERGEVDLLAALSVTGEDLPRFGYTSPILVASGAVYSLPGAATPTVERMRGSRVAVAGGGVAEQWCLERNIQARSAGSLVNAMRMVLEGEADYVVTTQIAARVDMRRFGVMGLEEHELDDKGLWRAFAIAGRSTDREMLDRIDRGLAELHTSGRFDALYDQYLSELQPRESGVWLTPERLLWIGGVASFAALAGLTAYAFSQRRLAQRTRALQVSEARFRVLFDESPDGILIVDPTTLVPLEVNPAMRALIGRSDTDLTTSAISSWCAEWEDPRHQEDVRRAVELGCADYDTKIRHADGRVIDVRCRVRSVNIEGRRLMQAVFRDITAAKRARETVERERRLFVAGPMVGFRWRNEPGWPIEHVTENVSQFGYRAEEFVSGMLTLQAIIHPDDIDRVSAEAALHIASGSTHFLRQYRIRTGDGREIWLSDYTSVVRDGDGVVTHLEGYVLDSTLQKVAADATRESEARYRAIVENTPALVFSYLIDEEGRPHLRVVNSQYERWREVFPWLEVGKDYRETVRPYIHPDDVDAYDSEVARARRDKDRFEIEFRLKTRSGEYRSLHSLAISMHSAQGVQWQCMLVDVTEMRRASEAARRSEERYREIFDRSHDAIVVFRPEDELILDANERALQLYGYSRSEFVGKFFSMVSMSQDRARGAIEKTVREGVFTDSAWRQRRRDGSMIHVDVVSSVIDFEGTKAIVSLNRDVTGRMKVENALSESERRYRSFVKHSSEGVWCIDFPVHAPVTLPIDEQVRLFYEHGVVTECNDAMARMYGLDRAEQLLGTRLSEMLPAHIPANVDYLRAIIQNGYRIDDAESHELDVNGNIKYFLNSVMCVVEEGRVVRAWGIQRDITAKRMAEQALAEARERFRMAVESADLGTWTYDVEAKTIEGDARYLSFFEIEAQAGAVPIADVRRKVHPDDLEAVCRAAEECARTGCMYRIEYRVMLDDGRVRWLSSRGSRAHGESLIIAGTTMDITEAKIASEERERLAEQLRQAQKLESLGVMAGGIAHDFNNLLVAIMGNAALALKTTPGESDAHRSISRIEQAAARASDLTRQLLTYAGRDLAEPQPIDITAVVREMVDLIEVSIDRSATVSVDLAGDIPEVNADPTQCRQVVMNLLSNASEALEGKPGRINVRTFVATLGEADLLGLHTQGCARPGKFVCLEVTDTGCGMDQAVQSRLFEPFFTTKFTGRGLGLTAVLGIMRRHNGAIGIESRPGEGTRFRVYFPASAAPFRVKPASGPVQAVSVQTGTILVIDDEAMVRDVARMCLEDAGFRVVAIPDGPQAITFAQAGSSFDGILLDMTMPSMSGPEVFAQIRRLRGNVPVLLTSGYAEENAAEQLLAEPKVAFIQKPYRPVQLVKAMQDLIAT
ncbi:MAG TPA: PAS domain S-box protein [Phycisphaerales bacterium]|nr:PAS domain S-box protein [Phycisphaerales bacterium]